MQDADLHEAVSGHTEAGHAHLRRTRWWFTSAAFPMIAGTLGPVASAFSICALVKPWRQHLAPGRDVTEAVFVGDPPWLLVINAIQLAIAVVANFFLLLNMTKRVRFTIAQPITIVGWYISSILLIALCATASDPLRLQPEAEYVWSQAFFYGLFAAILYFIVASLMVATIWGALAGHYPNSFDLTNSQRTLMLQTIMFLMYLLLGALVFSKIEGWLYLDAVYWADVTLFTVGLGDTTPQTTLGRALMIPYALIGITTLGLVIGSIRSLMLERGKRTLDARILEKKRRQFVRRLMRSSKRKILEPIMEEDTEYDLGGVNTKDPLEKSQDAELERRHHEYLMMRKIQAQASTRRRWTALGVSGSCWIVLWLVGAKIFQEAEAPYQRWTYFESVYFAFQAVTTIGYGDPAPVSNASKTFFVFWSLLALPTLTVLISNAGDTIVKGIRDATVLLGKITILPGERGYKRDVKHILSRLSFNKIFAEEILHEPPLDIHKVRPRNGSQTSQESSSGESHDHDHNHDHETQRSNASRKAREAGYKTEKSEMRRKRRRAAPERRDRPGEIPKDPAAYRLVLINEIRRVTKHLQDSPQRKYTYQEWAWYLRLIGEDESDVSVHSTPARGARRLVDHHNGDEDDKASRHRGRPPKWSWVGYRSPLMDTREEAEWILDKLGQRLQEELLAAAEESAGRGRIRGAGDIERRDDEGISVPNLHEGR
ncbi:hypothetical protein F4802DRAFT_564398 [Xylaria palmicola]|nr:hypothetical protein F4802DRAFT_564398 [Xylaria palmicola]